MQNLTLSMVYTIYIILDSRQDLMISILSVKALWGQ